VVGKSYTAGLAEGFWISGLPFAGVPGPNDASDTKYWAGGLPIAELGTISGARWGKLNPPTVFGSMLRGGPTGVFWDDRSALITALDYFAGGGTVGGGGDVVGPGSATDSVVALYNGTTGKLLKNSTVQAAWFNQGVLTTSTPTFASLTLSTGLTLSAMGGTNHVAKVAAGGVVSSGTLAATQLSDYVGATAYTPAWTTSGVAPSLGDGVLSGVYMKIGTLVNFSILFIMGTTTTTGTGGWSFSLPVTAVSTTPIGVVMIRQSGVQFLVANFVLASTTTVQVYVPASTSAMTGTSAFTWANTDALWITGSYYA